MCLYIRPIAPKALKVPIFMAERGIAVETVDVGDLPSMAPLRALAAQFDLLSV